MLHMIVEQTYDYPMRMKYCPETNSFVERPHRSMAYERHFTKPYGWIKESGTPPQPHWDCILMTENHFELGDEVEIRIVGMFKRADGDHKYIVVEKDRGIEDFSQLTEAEKEELNRLYPRVGEGEGWFGKDEALYCLENCEKAL